MISNQYLTILQEYGYFISKMKYSYSENKISKKLCFLTKNEAPFLIVFETDSDYTIEQLCENQDSGEKYCTLFMLCKLGESLFYSKNIKQKQFNQIRNLLFYNNTIKDTSATKAFIDENFENIFFEAHSDLRDLDGLHPDEALDELCKLIYVKLFDEEQNLNYFELQYGNIEEEAVTIRKLYQDANLYDVRVYSLKISGYKRSRGVFDESLYISSSSISKVVKRFSKYNFSSSDIDFKARAFQNVYLPATRAGMGQYFTPLEVIRLIINCIQPTKNDLIIDPFSGSGHFLTESLNYVKKSNPNLNSEFIFYKLHGIEKSERMVRIAMTDMRLHGDGHSNIRCADSLLPFESYSDLSENSFDIVMTNPPFGSNLQKESYSYLGKFDLLENKSKVPLEILGLERSVQLLRENGKLGIVIPDSIFVNNSNKNVREWISKNLYIRGIISLPLCTFSPFGANIKTSILIATKKNKNNTNYNIFTAIVENIGFDSKGKKVEGEDWPKVCSEFNKFILKEGW